ncbi:MAG: 50S ribosomal protein L15, partial [Ignavibacteria bacterium]|nr:50S ribosomal protein L15 [Ignavibacteria bacterium]
KLKYAKGSKKARKRIGRGEGSGHGGTSTKGMNGQHSRSGAKFRAWFEGGQMPLQRRIPKFGFTNTFKKEFQIINVSDLQKLADRSVLPSVITVEELVNIGALSSKKLPLKILGNGELKAKLSLEANAVSQSALAKIEAVGGSIKLV